MPLEEQVLAVASLASLAALIIFVTYFTPKLKTIVSEHKATSNIISGMLTELRNRAKQQDDRITKQQVAIDILKLRLDNLMAQSATPTPPIPTSLTRRSYTYPPEEEPKHVTTIATQKRIPRHITTRAPSTAKAELNSTEVKALELLAESARTPRQMQDLLGRSREHTARLMKELFERGYATRDMTKRPYIYEITGDGGKALETF